MPEKKHPLVGNQNASKGHGAHLHMRCKPREKSAWVKQSQRENLKLTEWVIKTLNSAVDDKQTGQ